MPLFKKTIHHLLKYKRCCGSVKKSNLFTDDVRIFFQSLNSCNCACLTSQQSKYLHYASRENFEKSQLSEIEEFQSKYRSINDKIIFNSILEFFKVRGRYTKLKCSENELNETNVCNTNKDYLETNLPVSLKYLKSVSYPESNEKSDPTENTTVPDEVVCLPYSIQTDMNDIDDIKENEKNYHQDTLIHVHNNSSQIQINSVSNTVVPNWMSDYEFYSEEGIEDEENGSPWHLRYGTPNSEVPISSVPCGGCGALLHCQDTAIPGYLPSELFEQQDEVSLRSMVCQRCHFMRFYDTALNVIVSPDDYPKLMAHLKHKVALILLLVDLLDFPCSIWPGIMDIIGHKQPIVIVANKVDLLPPDSRGFLHRIQKCLAENLTSSGIPTKNIKHIALISAKTGYGVEELITKLHNIWGYKGDVYLLGSTNVGKSTLFNALLQSDYCKVKAVDLIQRATTSPWPGTTINLLKFPILRPSGWQLYERTKRIISTRQQVEAQRRLHNLQLKENNAKNLPSLIGHIGMTFYTKTPAVNADPFSIERKVENPRVLCGLDPADETYAKSKWCYDTPGAVHPDQVIHLLTTEELMMTLPKKLVQPRTFRVSPNMSLFIAGLGRLDYVEGDGPIRMTVFSSSSLPLTICQIDDAAQIYDALLGSKLLGVPCGGSSRLSQWPGLKVHSRDFELQGCGWKESCGDILLSSAGWIAITAGKDKRCRFQAWTPGGVGVHLRCPPLLPFAVNLCGSKVRRSPAYRKGKGVYLK